MGSTRTTGSLGGHAVGVAGLAFVASALALAGLSLTRSTVPSWSLLAFEGVVACAGVFAMLYWRGRFRDQEAMTLVCIAGTVMAASALSGLGARWSIEVKGRAAGIGLTPWLLARTLLAAGVGVLGMHACLGRHPRGWRTFGKGIAAGVPVALALGVHVGTRGRAVEWLNSLPGAASAGAWAIIVLALAVSICAGGHFVIRSFEMSVDDGRGVADA